NLGNLGTLSLANTILATTGFDANCVGSVTSLGHNLDSDGSCALAAEGDLSSVDPKLGALADNGGPTQTQALLAGSPAIDAGTNSGCPSTDQRGQPRPKDGNGDGNVVCDMGA